MGTKPRGVHMRRGAAAASRGSGLGRTQGQTKRLQRQRVEVAPWCPAVCEPVGHSPWDSPGQNPGVRSRSLLQGISPTRDRTRLPHCRRILYQLSHQGSRAAKVTCNSPRSCFLTARALSDMFIWVLYSYWIYIILILLNISLKNKKEI